MADTGPVPAPRPIDWGDAFRALPMEGAPAGGWSRLATVLPVAGGVRPQRRLRLRVALAAALACALPAAGWLVKTSDEATDPPRAATAVGDTTRPTGAAPATATAAAPIRADAEQQAHPVGPAETGVPMLATPSATAVPQPRMASATRSADTGAMRRPAVRRAAASARDRVGDAASFASPRSGAPGSAGALVATVAPPHDELAGLRDASARLESLVALARDERVASAPAVVLAASLDDRIRAIDAALAGGGDSTSLWRERVDTLQALAVLEGTQRWMAAHGATPDTIAQID